MENVIQVDVSNVIIKRYKIRTTGREGRSIETTIPREVFEREARRLGLTVSEAIKRLQAVWRFNSFHGLHLAFEEIPRKKPIDSNEQKLRSPGVAEGDARDHETDPAGEVPTRR